MHRSILVSLVAVALSSLHAGAAQAQRGVPESAPPFEITEAQGRPRCANYTPQKQPLFGTTHLHTGLSFDASIRFVDYDADNTPRRAYQFAQGKVSMPLPSPLGFHDPLDPLRNPNIDRPLDFGAVTDHSEHFGEMGICKGLAGNAMPERVSMECRMINGFFYEPGLAPNPLAGRTLASNAFTQLTVTSLGAISRNTHTPMCEQNLALCEAAELTVWAEQQMAAEQEYDRSESCRFTTFIGYENTSTPLLNNWHRNVIFRNDRVVQRPVNAIDMAVQVNEQPTTGGPDGVGEPINTLLTIVPPGRRTWPVPPGTPVNHPLPQPFWNKLEDDCTRGRNITNGLATRCDFITIPHNSNLGGGLTLEDGITLFPPMFLDPYNRRDAIRHAEMEPLVEIYQDKGSSECRWDPRFGRGTETRDEFCAFELLDSASLGSASGVGGGVSSSVPAPEEFGERSYVRNILKDGLQFAAGAKGAEFTGVNPFKLGIVAASDSHTGVMGWHPENEDWPGHLGIDDAYPMARVPTIQNSTGGHTVVWAEENSRDSIFSALKNKETYGTSGTRPIVRFFGGWDFDENTCATDFVETGYRDGVPMGGDLPRRPIRARSPSFIVAAWRDDFVQTNLQQIHIIKGWVDDDGEKHEQVYLAAGRAADPLNVSGDVDPGTCKAYPDLGAPRLCAVWRDPDFDPSGHAFYYARVVEEPVCRYSTLWCRERIGVDPLNPAQCATDLENLASGMLGERLRAAQGAQCCLNDQGDETTNIVQPIIQERAWTSPIWYEPTRSN